MRWDEFTDACPELAGMARDRFAADEMVLLGTIRKDGRARISPCEIDFAAGRCRRTAVGWRRVRQHAASHHSRCGPGSVAVG